MFLLFLTSCSGSNGGFSNLVGGNLSDVSELTITNSTPSGLNPIIQIGQTQNFSILAETPPPNTVTYYWKLDGVQVSTINTYAVTGTTLNVGNHSVEAFAYDGVQTKSVAWTLKVNGPPVITPVTTGTPKVSVYASDGSQTGSQKTLTITATDPNSDTITYDWKVNGATSAYLSVGGGGLNATLTGNSSLMGSNTVTVTASDGSVSTSYSFTVEVNYFPQACNDLTQGSMCTYAGNPSLGDGLNPNSSDGQFIYMQPISTTVDDIGNLFISDYVNNLVWYWNQTSGAVTRLGVSIPANTIKVVAGTGEAASGPDGIALQSAIYSPRGLAYNSSTGYLYVSEWSGNKIKVIDNLGNISTGMGGSNHDATVDESAYLQACTNPAGLFIDTSTNYMYVACYSSHRIRRWNLANDQAKRIDTNTYPYDLYVNGSTLYATYLGSNIVRKGTLDGTGGLSVAMSTLIGTGVAANDNNLVMASNRVYYPSGIAEIAGKIFLASENGNWLMVGNTTGATVTYGAVSITSGKIARISNTGGAYTGDGNVNISQFNNPYDIAVDPNNTNLIYISDYSNARVRKLDLSTLNVKSVVGSGENRAGNNGSGVLSVKDHKFNFPTGLAVDNSDGSLFTIDSRNYRIMEITKYGQAYNVLGNGAGTPSVPNDLPTNTLLQTYPVGNSLMGQLTILADKSLAFANIRSHNFRLWNRSGGDKSYLSIYTFNNRVQNIAGDYLSGASAGAPINVGDPSNVGTSTSLNYPGGVAMYFNGTDYEGIFADTYNHCIRAVDSSGDLTTVAGQCGTTGAGLNSDTPANMRFAYPQSVLTDSLGNIIITDTWNHKIRYFNRTGSTTTFAGVSVPANTVKTIACNNGTSGTAAENQIAVGARCYYPTGLAMSTDNLCYTQYYRHNVRCIYLTGANIGRVRTVAGALEATPAAGSPYNYSLEGTSATQQFLYYPTGLAFDSNGDLYISDSNNSIIKKVKLSP